jgi:hypothetical protein
MPFWRGELVLVADVDVDVRNAREETTRISARSADVRDRGEPV